MRNVNELTEEFKAKYERFLIGCDAVEELEKWDKEAYGEMDVFYENDLVGVILRLIAADGEISEKETEYLNRSFGFAYTTKELVGIYENCAEAVSGSFDAQFQNGITLMRAINEKLADAYRELLDLICNIIIKSDGVIAPEEIEEAKRLRISIQ